MDSNDPTKGKSSVRTRADEIKGYRCKNLIAVIENPKHIQNIGTVIRNVDALGVEKTYVVDPRRALPEEWQEMREGTPLSRTSASAVKWSFVKRFDSTCLCRHFPPPKGSAKRSARRGRLHGSQEACRLVWERVSGHQRPRRSQE